MQHVVQLSFIKTTTPPCRPPSALVACCCCLPPPSVVASFATSSPRIISYRLSAQQHCRQHCHCVLLLPPPCQHCHCVLLIPPPSLLARRLSHHSPPAPAAATCRSLPPRTTPLLLSSVFSFVPSLSLSTMQFDAVPSAPVRGAAVALSSPPLGPMKLLSSSS